MQGSRFTYRSVFWPILLIGVGLVLYYALASERAR